MARTKKKKQNTDALVYSGNVTVQVLHKNKVVSTKKIHNQGRISLFKFIAYALGNNYFEKMAPRFLRAFNCTQQPTEENLGDVLTADSEISDIVAFSSITYDEDATTAKVNLSFLIPGSHIVNSDSTLRINTLCLYSQDTFSDSSRSNPLAYVYLTNQQGQEDPITFTSGVNLVIIWELSVGNQVQQ